MEEEEKFIICECGCEEQIVLTSWFDDDAPMMFVTYQFYQPRGFFSRLRKGLRYAFGHYSRYGDFGEVVLNEDAAKDLRDFCDRFLALAEAVELCPK